MVQKFTADLLTLRNIGTHRRILSCSWWKPFWVWRLDENV